MALEIAGNGVALRDFTLGDLPARLRWQTEETEWQQWDAPWEYEGQTAEEAARELAALRARLGALARRNMELGEQDIRWGFEVYRLAPRGNIGWVNSYCLDDNLDYAPQATGRHALGIDLPPPDCRGQGLGRAALGLFVRYLLERGVTQLYTQTWSGNLPMVALAHSLGFEACRRLPGARQVRGASYDALTFALNVPRFEEAWPR